VLVTPRDRLVVWVWHPRAGLWRADRAHFANEREARDRASDLRLAGHEARVGDTLIGPPEGPPDPWQPPAWALAPGGAF
jgi:hypothetical protein